MGHSTPDHALAGGPVRVEKLDDSIPATDARAEERIPEVERRERTPEHVVGGVPAAVAPVAVAA